MTIEEAIKRTKEVSEECKESCIECAKEHEQLAEWLEELQARRKNESKIRADERVKVINEVKQYLLNHKKTVKEIETKHIYDAVKAEWIVDLKAGEENES